MRGVVLEVLQREVISDKEASCWQFREESWARDGERLFLTFLLGLAIFQSFGGYRDGAKASAL